MHIFKSRDQKATSYKSNGFKIIFKDRKLLWCNNCKIKRWAKNLLVHSYYDGDYFFCKKGKGCKK